MKVDNNTSLKQQIAELRAAKKECSTITLEPGQEAVFILSLIDEPLECDDEHAIKFQKIFDAENLRTKRIILIGITSIVLSVLLFALL